MGKQKGSAAKKHESQESINQEETVATPLPAEDEDPVLKTALSIPLADEAVKKIWDKVNGVVRDKRLKRTVVPDTALFVLDQAHITADLTRKLKDKCEDNVLIKQKPETEVSSTE